MIDRSLLRNIDWPLLSLLLLNSIIGIVFIYSSSHYVADKYYLRQIIWLILSVAALFLFLLIDYEVLVTYSLYFYLFIAAVLVGILFFGKLIAGARSWIALPFFSIQPSELMKIAVILLLAHVFSEVRSEYLSLKKGLISGAVVAFPCLLIALQPDLGTALTFLPILIASFILGGLNKKAIIFLLVICICVGFFGWNFALKDYQKKRIMTLILPGQDPLGSGYHITQSKIAVGSGGLFGKGYKKGTQSQLRFLPARHTDFIFSVIGEESGFVGVLLTLLFYSFFLSRLFQSVWQSRDRAGVYIIIMVAVMIAFQFLSNVMMVIGVFPITGVPLPLLSYGGSSLLTNYIGVSLVLNVTMRRFVNV